MFKLGEKVRINGRLEQDIVTKAMVDQMEATVRLGVTVVSRKYETIPFFEPKTGIIVGVRSVVDYRKHFLDKFNDGEMYVATKTVRQKAYLVACDLRGLYRVTADCIESIETDDELEDIDGTFEFVDELEELYDELDKEFAL